jgi:acetyl-CoA acyltransferase
MGWRFINKALKEAYGVETMPETAENVAHDYGISRADQDAFALASQNKAALAIAEGIFAREIVPVAIPERKANRWCSRRTSIRAPPPSTRWPN